MSELPIERLPSSIADLLEREKDAYPEDAAMKQAVFARVEMALVLAGPGPGAGGSGLGGAGGAGSTGAGAVATTAKGALAKLFAVGLSAFVAGGVTGGLAVKSTSNVVASRPSVLPVLPGTTNAPAAWTAILPVAPPTASGVAPSAAPPHASATTAPATVRPGNSAGDLTRERELLDVARAALARGKPEDAIVAAQQHASRWPHGYLAEEREVVYIQALVAAGRSGEATEKAARFHRTFPSSMLGPVVDAAVAGPPRSP